MGNALLMDVTDIVNRVEMSKVNDGSNGWMDDRESG